MPAPSVLRRLRRVAERIAVAHFAAYPLAFVWAVAAIPLTIHLSARDLDALGGDMDTIGQLIMRRLLWPAGAAFVLAHGAALPWILAREDRAGQRRCLAILGGVGGAGLVAGAASWLWLWLR